MKRAHAGRPLIFDLDDTLIQSFPTYALLHQRVAEDLGLDVPTRDALVPYAATWEETVTALWPGLDLEAFVRRYDELALAHPYPAFPGAVTALETLRALGHPLFIVTKRSQRHLFRRLAEAGVRRELFDGIFPVEVQPACKPDPRCFEPVWQALGRRSAEALYVGDREEDRRAAGAARIEFVAVLTGPEVAMGFPGDHPATAVIATVAALPDWLSTEP